MASLPPADRRVIEKEELADLLPHKGKMLLISRILEYDINARFLRSEYDVCEGCLFYDSALEGVPSYVCFEFMAQAISALSGLTGKILGKPPMIGFILSVSSLEIKLPVFRPGDIIQIAVNEEHRIDMVSTFRCVVATGSSEAASAKLMVMDVENPEEFIKKRNYGK